ncbi:MAG TPA: hypothetical protein PKC58_02940 [Ignavibacteria bacterium]|nr:hypothetical protein [Ignavibacteria bacterium]
MNKKSILKIKAIEIILTFSETEKSDFKKFLSSPYFNSSSILVKLYSIILNKEKEIRSENITEKEIYHLLFDSEKFSYSSFRNQMSSLYKICDEFLLINAVRNNDEYDFENKLKMLNEYSRRFLDSNYHLLFEKLKKDQNYKYLGSKFFENMHKLNYNFSHFEYLRNNSHKRRKSLYESTINSLCGMISGLSEDIAKINYIEKIYNHKVNLNPAKSLIDNLNVKNFLKEIKSLDKVSYDFINTELKFMDLILQPENIDNYKELKKLVFSEITKYSNSERYYHTGRLLSFVINYYNNDSQNFYKEVSEFRKFQLKNIKYGKDGVASLNMRTFADILNSFLMTEKIQFIETFVKENLKKIESINRENALNYAMARIEIMKGNNDQALEYLSKLKLTEPLFKFFSKMLMIQIYYDMGYFESGLNALDSLKHFMKNNNDINAQLKERYNLLIKISYRIYKIKLKPESFTMFDIESLLKDNSKIKSVDISWYQKKIEELKDLF